MLRFTRRGLLQTAAAAIAAPAIVACAGRARCDSAC